MGTMTALENPRHERFAQLVASGVTGSAAYRQVRGKDMPGAGAMAHKWMKKVKGRVKELKDAAEAVQKTATEDKMRRVADEAGEAVARIVGRALSLEEMLAFLALSVITPIGKLDGANMLTHSIETTSMPGPDADAGSLPLHKLKAHDKLKAIELSAKLQGMLVEKVDLNAKVATTPDAILSAVRMSPALRGLPLPSGNS